MRLPKIFSIVAICLTVASVVGLTTLSSCLGSNPIQVYSYIIYDDNGSTGGSLPGNLDYVSNVLSFNQLTSDTSSIFAYSNSGNLTKSGYDFNGWNTDKSGSGHHYNEGGRVVIKDLNWKQTKDGANEVTLYAEWKLSLLSVTYNGNGNDGGTVPSDNNTYQLGSNVTVLDNTGNLAKTGFTFNGWNTAANGSGTSYMANAIFAMGTASVTLYAQWAPTYTVTYNGNGNTSGTTPADNNTYQQGANVTVLDNTGNLVKTGSTFSGWNTAANGSGTSYMANAIFAMGTANVTLYAQWAPSGGGSQYTVSYDGNGSDGGTVPSDNTSYAANAQATVLGQGSMTMTGFTFTGWNTTLSPQGGPFDPSTHYNAGDKITMTGNVTLYAEWMPSGGGIGGGTYQVTYNGNGNTSGTPPIDSNLYAPGTSVNVYGNMIGNLAKTGFTFSGWNTKADGTGTHYAGDGTAFFTINANVTFYAEWQ